MTSHSEETVFISGGTSGLGFELAEHFASTGKNVIFCGRNEEAVHDTLEYLNNLSVGKQLILGFSNDVSDRKTTMEMLEKIHELKIVIDVLICNAGVIGPIDRFMENKVRDWEYAFNVNLYGILNLVMGVLPSMIAREEGKVIHISGGGATAPLFGMSSYAASKAAAVRFIETLALEYKDLGISFNSVAPGMLKTRLLEQMLEAGPNRIGGNLFTKSLAKSEALSDTSQKVISLIDFLSSELSIGITGKLISAEWDNWAEWPNNLEQLKNSDLYTLRRITGRDRGQQWGDL
jgi:NAD(P)-dependent dehydrogenase (short-subunit alcohol dehydrogenase family)